MGLGVGVTAVGGGPLHLVLPLALGSQAALQLRLDLLLDLLLYLLLGGGLGLSGHLGLGQGLVGRRRRHRSNRREQRQGDG